ncbi:MDR family MFS transporter [Streptomyces sp. NPDC088762]|uniref:MDR family MFS transporter n=1 Tax=Streptomyces sp. NPDC088762 TaxID=3365891 RepID=UPI00381C4570
MDQLIAGDPTRIGPYRVIARLGAGGMGLVYLGRSEGGRTVAVKVVQAEHAGHAEFRRRFAREVAAARRVGGSWTADVLDADPEAAVPWVATQYIPGPDLQTVVAKDFGPLPEHSVRTLANRLALALQAVHGAGLIHRDLKPSNVLVTVDGPRVIDFGIARAMDSLGGDSLLTRTGTLIGSAGFMSPEQVRGLELTPASDVFCLGAVLVYAATGRLLFGAGDTGLNAHLFRVAEEEADLTGVPETLVDLVRACLEKDPARRPTPEQIAERTAADQAGEWLPGAVLAQLGRHAAQLLDYAPEVPAGALAGDPAGTPAEPPPQPRTAPPPPPPAYAPTAPAHFVPGQGFGPPPDAGSPHPRRWWGLAVIAVAQLMVLLDAISFTMAAPFVRSDLHLDFDDVVLSFKAYALAFGCVLLLGGYLADLVGRRLTLIIGLAGCAAASALGGLAPNSGTLVAARALEGVFAALVTPSALALVAGGFTDPKERGRAFAIYGGIAGGGVALWELTGSLLMEFLSWRVSLYTGVLLAVIALIGALTLLHDRPGPVGARVDVPGLLLGTGGLGALTYGATEAGWRGWIDPLTLVLFLAGAGLLAAFLWSQTRTSGPFRSLSAVRGRDRVGCFLALLLAGLGITAAFPHLFFAIDNGLLFLPFVAAIVIGSAQSARLLRRAAPRTPIAAGLVCAAAGLAVLTGFGPGSPAVVVPGMLLTGFGTGLAFVPLFATATADPQHSGVRSATVTAAQHVGGAIGPGLLAHEGLDASPWWAVGALLLAGLIGGLMVTARAPEADAAPVLKGGW